MIRYPLKAVLFLILLLIFSGLNAVRYIDNRLFFDIFLDDVKTIELISKGNIYIQSDKDSSYIECSNLLKINYKKVNESFEIIIENDFDRFPDFRIDSVSYNSWQNGFFEIKKKAVKISQKGFISEEKASAFAKKHNIKKYKLKENSGNVLIKGKEYALPLMILSDSPIEFMGVRYNGLIRLIDSEHGSMKVINCIDMEEYIAGVIPYEIGLEAPYEALKAQAVAARSQTIYKILNNRHASEGYDLCKTTHCQVYKGLTKQNENTYRAAIETSNEILIYQDKVVDAVFHSCCGGSTEDAKDAWGTNAPYLVHTDDYRSDQSDASENNPYCSQGGQYVAWYQKAYEWTEKVSKQSLGEKLGIGTVTDIQIIKRGKSGRIHKMKVSGTNGSETLNKELQIRSLFNNAKSSSFTLKDNGSNYILYGHGMGHGVGLCQIGAIVQAHIGYNYIDILSFYYKDTMISNQWILKEFINESEE